jgi:fimbrial chaperone protein
VSRFQVRAFAWDETPLGEMKLAPAKDLVAFPGVLEVAPGQERKIRVGTTAEPGERERTWRVFLEEILPAETRADTTRIRTRLRLGIPVFFAPIRRVSGAEIVGLGVESAKVTFLLKNAGTVHIRPSAVRVAIQDRTGKAVFERSFEGWYVLAGGDRLYEVDLPAEICAQAANVTATALGEVPVESARVVVSGACAP